MNINIGHKFSVFYLWKKIFAFNFTVGLSHIVPIKYFEFHGFNMNKMWKSLRIMNIVAECRMRLWSLLKHQTCIVCFLLLRIALRFGGSKCFCTLGWTDADFPPGACHSPIFYFNHLCLQEHVQPLLLSSCSPRWLCFLLSACQFLKISCKCENMCSGSCCCTL